MATVRCRFDADSMPTRRRLRAAEVIDRAGRRDTAFTSTRTNGSLGGHFSQGPTRGRSRGVTDQLEAASDPRRYRAWVWVGLAARVGWDVALSGARSKGG